VVGIEKVHRVFERDSESHEGSWFQWDGCRGQIRPKKEFGMPRCAAVETRHGQSILDSTTRHARCHSSRDDR